MSGSYTSLWRFPVLALALVCFATAAFAQGRQTGTVVGTVTDRDGLVIPGATVTLTSPALQGVRVATTDGNGNYTVPGLPPGEYTVRFELTGMKVVEARQRVDLGLTARVDAQLQLDTLTEVVTVVAATPSIVTSVSTGANYRGEMVDKLASPSSPPASRTTRPTRDRSPSPAPSPTTTSSSSTAWTSPTTCSAPPTTSSSKMPSRKSRC